VSTKVEQILEKKSAALTRLPHRILTVDASEVKTSQRLKKNQRFWCDAKIVEDATVTPASD